MHRDLKPSNILINSQCCVKICDFGMARLMLESNMMPDKNETAAVVDMHRVSTDTPYVLSPRVQSRWYRCPEVMLQDPCYDSKVDVFSIGLIAYELITYSQNEGKGLTESPTLFRGKGSFPYSCDEIDKSKE